MRAVKTPTEVYEILKREFNRRMESETVPLIESFGRVVSCDIAAAEFVPDFDRSTVDGYAVRARDTFGCSDAIPALLKKTATIEIGEDCARIIGEDECAYIPTGGKLPEGADAAVMLEYAQEFDGLVCIQKAAAPGTNLVKRGDDAFPNKIIIPQGCVIRGQDMGALAALGVTLVPTSKKPKIAIISTGNELADITEKPTGTKIRDINTYALYGAALATGAIPVVYGRFRDNLEDITAAITTALAECDIVLVSGGSSVGTADLTVQAIQNAENGDSMIFAHGIALKPGKPTIIARVGKKPVYGLPGHPASAYFVFMLFVRPLVNSLLGIHENRFTSVQAELAEDISSNHGREEGVPVRLITREQNPNNTHEAHIPLAFPIGGKSGMISLLSDSHGYIMIERDCEGLSKGMHVSVLLF